MHPTDARLEVIPPTYPGNDVDTYRVIGPDGTYYGNVVDDLPKGWLSQPVDIEQTTVWGCPTMNDAIQYLLDMHDKGVYVEGEGE